MTIAAAPQPPRRVPPWVKWVVVPIVVLVLAVAAFLNWFNWNRMRGPIGRWASAAAHRTIVIHGDLKVHLLSWTPGAQAYDVTIGGTPGVGPSGQLAELGEFAFKIKLIPLLIGRVELPLIDLENPQFWAYRGADGRTNWRAPDNETKPTKLPPIQHLVINNGSLQLVDEKRRMTLRAHVQSSETMVGSGQGSFQLTGQGSINRDPFILNLSGGALIDVKTDRPYNFDAHLKSGRTEITAHGQLPRPFDFGQVRTALNVSGADLADLYYLTGVAFPNTPPFQVRANVVRDEQKYTFTDMDGHIGRSDLEGGFQVDHDGARPKVNADLRSRSLDMVDLAAVLGSRVSDTAGSTVAKPIAPAGAKLLLPDAKLDLTRIRSTDAVVHYRAESILARPNLPLRRATLGLTLDHGLLVIDPITFGFPQGQLTGQARVDARTAVPEDTVDLKVTNVQLQNFLSKSSAANPPVEGAVEARAKLTGRGESVHDVAASANGEVTFVVPHGAVRQAFAELLGIDVSRALGLIMAKDQSQMGVRCAVADFHADNGVLGVRNLVFDTDKVRAKGTGDIDLKDESVNLTIHGEPKGFRLIRLNAPITVGGHLSALTFGIKPGAAPAQAGAAVVLGATLSPLAAILPFVDPGLAHDADCVAAIQNAQSQGVPVKPSATTPTNAKAAPVAAKSGK